MWSAIVAPIGVDSPSLPVVLISPRQPDPPNQLLLSVNLHPRDQMLIPL